MAFTSPIPSDARHKVLQRAIGEFIATWSHVEWSLVFVFGGLVRIDFNQARIILAAMINFRSRRELLERLGRAYLPDNDLAEWAKLMAQIKHLSEKRNHMAHRRAYFMERSTFRFFSDEDELQPNTFGRYTDYQIGNIRAWSKEAVAVQETLMRWHYRLIHTELLEQPRVIPEPEQGQGA